MDKPLILERTYSVEYKAIHSPAHSLHNCVSTPPSSSLRNFVRQLRYVQDLNIF